MAMAMAMAMRRRNGGVTGGDVALALALSLVLAGCGGGGSDTPTSPSSQGGVDTTAYSSAANASLASGEDASVATVHSIVVGGRNITYTASVGHLTVRDPASGAAEASMFYVAYTAPASAGNERPLIHFFNGGPGSATVWLHLGSFAPRRIVTNAPSLDLPQPFRLVDNADSLIDVADLVFIDAVGTGYSEAIAPFTNQSFWGVDADARVMRDFIARYAATNGRAASPTYLLGESYGTTRAAVLADLMVAAGMRLDGVVLQSSILDYNANCDVVGPGQLSCAGNLPSYGMIAAWRGLVLPPPADDAVYAQQLRDFGAVSYAPAIDAFLHGTPVSAPLLDQLAGMTGAPRPLWAAQPNLGADSFRRGLLPGRLLGRYDARVDADVGSALAASGDPSAAVINGPFAAAARSLFSQELGYSATAGYTLLSNAIASWHFDHDGRALPDVVPDLAAALSERPALRVLSLSGYHDLATPFWQTERDLARLGAAPGLATRVYAGGHMTYLDDASRGREKVDLAAFLSGAPLGAAADRRVALALPPAVGARTALPLGAPVAPAPVEVPDRSALAQGGDPVVPPVLRVPDREPSPSGAALAALVAKKIAARQGDRGKK